MRLAKQPCCMSRGWVHSTSTFSFIQALNLQHYRKYGGITIRHIITKSEQVRQHECFISLEKKTRKPRKYSAFFFDKNSTSAVFSSAFFFSEASALSAVFSAVFDDIPRFFHQKRSFHDVLFPRFFWGECNTGSWTVLKRRWCPYRMAKKNNGYKVEVRF